MSDSANGDLVQRMRRLADRAREKGAETQATEPGAEIARPVRASRGRAGVSIIEEAQLELFRMERLGRFEREQLHPESEYPTFLTRLPVFVPARRSHQRELLDNENAMVFETSWGSGRKFGPPLTVYDEDTLIAIGKLRQNRLIGRAHNMPVPLSSVYRHTDTDVSVHVVHCLLTDIQNVCMQSLGGRNLKMRLDSVKRLASTVLEITPHATNKFVKSGTSFKLVDVAWQEFAKNAVLLIQFHPVMAAWYDHEYTWLDWSLRQKLTDTGKALHRFLSSQPKDYEIGAAKLLRTIGYMREHKKFMVDLRTTLAQLQAENWLKEWHIDGNGRNKPHKLIIKRR